MLLLLLLLLFSLTTPARLILVVWVITFVLLTQTFSFINERLLLGGSQQPSHNTHLHSYFIAPLIMGACRRGQERALTPPWQEGHLSLPGKGKNG